MAQMFMGEGIAFSIENFEQEGIDVQPLLKVDNPPILISFPEGKFNRKRIAVLWASPPIQLFSWKESNHRIPLVYQGDFTQVGKIHRIDDDSIGKVHRIDVESTGEYILQLDDLNRTTDEPFSEWRHGSDRKWYENDHYLSNQLVNQIFTQLCEKDFVKLASLLLTFPQYLFPGKWIYYFG